MKYKALLLPQDLITPGTPSLKSHQMISFAPVTMLLNLTLKSDEIRSFAPATRPNLATQPDAQIEL